MPLDTQYERVSSGKSLLQQRFIKDFHVEQEGGEYATGVLTGIIASVSNTTITFAATASAYDDDYKGLAVFITSGDRAGQYRIITGYVGSTRIATIDSSAPNWLYDIYNPTGVTTYALPVAGTDTYRIESPVRLDTAKKDYSFSSAATGTLVLQPRGGDLHIDGLCRMFADLEQVNTTSKTTMKPIGTGGSQSISVVTDRVVMCTNDGVVKSIPLSSFSASSSPRAFYDSDSFTSVSDFGVDFTNFDGQNLIALGFRKFTWTINLIQDMGSPTYNARNIVMYAYDENGTLINGFSSFHRHTELQDATTLPLTTSYGDGSNNQTPIVCGMNFDCSLNNLCIKIDQVFSGRYSASGYDGVSFKTHVTGAINNSSATFFHYQADGSVVSNKNGADATAAYPKIIYIRLLNSGGSSTAITGTRFDEVIAY